MDAIFSFLEIIDKFYWSTIGVSLIFIVGLYLTIANKFYPIKILFNPRRTFSDLIESAKNETQGCHPIKLYFSSVSGMAGLGNIVSVISALTIGGPGALFWVWISAICGMSIKYSEVYLGVKYRQKNIHGGYDGGPMYYLQAAYKSKFLQKFFYVFTSILLWIYGVEIYQFSVITETMSQISNIDKIYIVPPLVCITLYAGLGGIKRLANICSIIGPIFISFYFMICLYVIGVQFEKLPAILLNVFQSAFTGHAATGGFVGSTLLLAMQYGVQRAVYSGDIAIGYDAIIHSETKAQHPARQARMAVFSVFTDAVFCTLSILVVLISGLWTQTNIDNYVSESLAIVIPYSNIFMAIFIFIAGWTTIIAFLAVGQKAAYCLFPKYGKILFFLYSAIALTYFAFFDYQKVYIIMSLSGGLLVLCNLLGIIKLRKSIHFERFDK